MFKPSRKRKNAERGALLAGAFLVSMALVVSMLGLLSYSRNANRQAESLLIRNRLGRMAQEKFTRDLLALNKNVDLKSFDTSPVLFSGGEAQSTVQPVPAGLSKFDFANYLVVVATVTKNNAPDPRHIRLETILDLAAPSSVVPFDSFAQRGVPVSQVVDDQLRTYLSENDPQFQEAKKQIMAALKDQFGFDVDSLLVPSGSSRYRDPLMAQSSHMREEDKQDAFFLSPILIESPPGGLRVRVWKETYY